MTCPHCQTDNREGRRFCAKCGAALALVCPSCGFVNEPGDEFCGGCGKRPAPFAPTSPESPARHTPKHLDEKVLISRGALEGERKQVTVLFADLKGSMELLADRDPEEARGILDPVLERMMEAVHRYEGTVNQVMGDGIMALFGAPLAHEDHAVRACYAALRMLESVKSYAAEMHRTRGIQLAIRVGLNSGDVVVRSIGSDLRMDYTAVGQTSHLAARMEQAARPGTGRLTAATLRLAEGLIEVRPLGPTAIRGLAEPVEVFELVGVGPNRTRLEAGADRGLTPLVGRDAEVARLHEAVELAERGQGQVVALVGEPGVGKSRLVWELTRVPRIQGWLTLAGRSESYSSSTPYLPVVELLKGYFRIEPSDDRGTIPEKVIAKLTALDEALASTHTPLLALLDAPVDDVEWPTLDPALRRRRTLDAVKRLLIRESQERPLLLVFEDLHWIDAQTQAFLNSLVEALAGLRALLVVSYRPQYRHQWEGQAHYRRLPIDPLPSITAEALLRSLLGGDPSLRTVIPLLIERTEGNPFFLEEAVRTLVDNGVLGGEPGARHVARALHEFQLPATVEAVVAARIDALSLDDKRLLQAAAVIGRDVAASLLAVVAAGPEAEVRRGIARLQAAEFLYETRRFPDPEYTFKHALSHDVAYRSLLKDRRRALHVKILEAVETLHAERLAERVDQLGSHALRGEVWDKAVHYLQQAGAKAFDRSANRQAVTYYEAALGALARLPESPDTVARAIDLRFDLRNVLHALGEFERVVGYLREAEALARRLADQRRLGWALGYQAHFFTMRGDYDRAVEAGRHALAIADTVGEPGVSVIANAYLGLACLAQGDYRGASEFHRQTMVSAAGTGMRERAGLVGLAAAYAGGFLAWSLAELGRFDDATTWGGEAIRVAEGTKHPYTQIVAEAGVGYLHRRRGNFDTAIPLLEHSMSLCRATDNRVLFPFVASLLGASYACARRLSEALPLLEQAVESAVSIRLAVARPLPVGLLGEAYLIAGRPDQALEEANRALDLSRKHHERGFEGWAWHLLGEIHSRRPAAEAATESYGRALAIAEDLGMQPLAAHCHLGLGKLYRHAGKREQAHGHLTTAAAMYREMDMRFWLEQVNQPGGESP